MLSFLSRGARTFGLPTPLTRPIPPDVGHDSATVRKVPHFPAESCPTSQRNAAPLQTESVPHFDRNPQLPRNGSYTNSPRLVWFTIGRRINSSGFCVG